MEFIIVGEIIKAQGIKGEVKVKTLTDDPLRFKKLKLVYIDTAARKILSLRIDGVFAYLLLSGVENRDDALKLVGKFIQIDKVNAVALPEDSYFITDLIGCKVISDNGLELGTITDVGKYGAADVITAKSADKIFRFPFLKKIVQKVDIENKLFIIIKEQFDGVCVYED